MSIIAAAKLHSNRIKWNIQLVMDCNDLLRSCIEVEVEATSIPAHLELDMEGLAAGASLYASDVKLPEGVTLVSDAKMPVVHLSVRSATEEVVAAPAATEGAEGGEAAAPAAEAAKS